VDAPHAQDPETSACREDVALARKARAGNPDAVDEFLRRIGCVRRFQQLKNEQLGRPLGNHELEDVLQETLFALWQKLDLYEGGGPLEAWAYRFAYVRLLTRVRNLDLRPRLIDDVLEELSEPQAPPTQDAFRFELLYRTLERIDAADRDLIREHVFEQRTFAELAAQLGVPVGTVKTRFYRAITKLRELLGASDEGSIVASEKRT
jgi:RNA polymerase sigma-70 factor (ECF subfamily)